MFFFAHDEEEVTLLYIASVYMRRGDMTRAGPRRKAVSAAAIFHILYNNQSRHMGIHGGSDPLRSAHGAYRIHDVLMPRRLLRAFKT